MEYYGRKNKKTFKFKDQLIIQNYYILFNHNSKFGNSGIIYLMICLLIDLNQFLSNELGDFVNYLLDVGRINSALASEFTPNLKLFSFAFYSDLKAASSSAYSFSVYLCLRKAF